MTSTTCGAPTTHGGRCSQPVANAGRCAAGHPARGHAATTAIGSGAAAVATVDPMCGSGTAAMATDQIRQGLDRAVSTLEGSTNGNWVCDDYDLTIKDCRATLADLAPLDGHIGRDSVPTGLSADALAALTPRELVQQAHLNLTGAAQWAARPSFANDTQTQERVAWERRRAKEFLTAAVIADAAYTEAANLTRMGGGADGGGWTNRGEIISQASRALGRDPSEPEVVQWTARLASSNITIRG